MAEHIRGHHSMMIVDQTPQDTVYCDDVNLNTTGISILRLLALYFLLMCSGAITESGGHPSVPTSLVHSTMNSTTCIILNVKMGLLLQYHANKLSMRNAYRN